MTRHPVSRASQMLCYMSSLPFGFGVQEIQQHLRVDEARGIVHACNLALISLGPLGLWKLGIEGTWEPREDGIVADVRFSRAAIRPVSFWGFTVGESACAWLSGSLPDRLHLWALCCRPPSYRAGALPGSPRTPLTPSQRCLILIPPLPFLPPKPDRTAAPPQMGGRQRWPWVRGRGGGARRGWGEWRCPSWRCPSLKSRR